VDDSVRLLGQIAPAVRQVEERQCMRPGVGVQGQGRAGVEAEGVLVFDKQLGLPVRANMPPLVVEPIDQAGGWGDSLQVRCRRESPLV
jgi:hypothetical protein